MWDVAKIPEIIELYWDGEPKERSWLKLPSCQCQLDGRAASFPAHRKHYGSGGNSGRSVAKWACD
jgi:hypothetical protein